MAESGKKFCAEYAKRGTAGCKKCKTKIEKGLLRIGKIVPNPFSDAGGDMKEWYHLDCIFESFLRARATTKKIEETDDIEAFQELEKDDRKAIIKKIDELQEHLSSKTKTTSKKTTPKKGKEATRRKASPVSDEPSKKRAKEESEENEAKSGEEEEEIEEDFEQSSDESHKDNAFKEFRKLCAKIYDESSYTGKTNIVKEFLKRGTSGQGFKGDTFLWVKFLLPMVNKRVYNLQSKQLCKLFSRIFGGSYYEEMVEDLEQGDVAETIAQFHEKATKCPPAKKGNLSLHKVDRYLEKLSKLTREEDQADMLERIAKECTANDLKMVVRLIKHDIRINAGPKHILDALNPAAYAAFQTSLDLKEVVKRSLAEDFGNSTLSVGIKLCTPVRPMLAEPCRSVAFAFKRCPNGMYSEVKYDGERVQLHKEGSTFLYYSRSLKPVVAHKVSHFKDFIPKAFPLGESMIIDGEILLINTKTDEILPFGTLGAHKKLEFKDASVCLFVFDCLFYNGKSLLNESLQSRRKILQTHMTEVKHHVMFSEMEYVKTQSKLKAKIEDAINKGLEGLVLKDPDGIYEPGKRHWMKVKKDYLEGGSMADAADLVVLGAYFGTGSKGGIKSVFLMGCFNPASKKWVTVTKVHTGHDDKTLARLQKELKMKKISKNVDLVPTWLDVKSQLVPDFVAEDPLKSQVWEITGAEFSKAEAHTANGISIRFPRVTRIRDDKEPPDATSLPELENLFKISKEQVLTLKENVDDDDGDDDKSGSSASTSPAKTAERRSPRKKAKIKEEISDDEKTIPIKKENDSDEVETKKSKLPPCDLPKVFTGIVISKFPEDFKYHADLSRYFVAYDGKISRKNVTHRIGTQKGTYRVDWIWESIKRRRLLDESRFKN